MTNTTLKPFDAGKKQYLANVLIAEDNRVDAMMFEAMLQQFGCYVDHCEGVDIADKFSNKYDIIFLDVNMPNVSGFHIADSLQNHPKTDIAAHTNAVVLVSGEPYTDEIRHKCLKAAVDGYVQKPIREDILERLLEEYIPNREIEVLQDHEEVKGFFRKNRS